MPEAPTQMQCMEVWGGSQLTTRGVEMGGLDAWVYSKPYEQEHISAGRCVSPRDARRCTEWILGTFAFDCPQGARRSTSTDLPSQPTAALPAAILDKLADDEMNQMITLAGTSAG